MITCICCMIYFSIIVELIITLVKISNLWNNILIGVILYLLFGMDNIMCTIDSWSFTIYDIIILLVSINNGRISSISSK